MVSNHRFGGKKFMPTIVHFDIPADNTNRAKKFYKDLFNWDIEQVPGPMEYFNIATKHENGEQGVRGGLGQRQERQMGITNYIGVPSINEYIKKVEDLGGKIIIPKTTIPGFGYLAVFLDTEQNPLGLWEEDSEARM